MSKIASMEEALTILQNYLAGKLVGSGDDRTVQNAIEYVYGDGKQKAGRRILARLALTLKGKG